MNVLIIKLGATGDVVRTTPLLRRLNGNVTWITAAKNTIFFQGLRENLKCVSWEQRHLVQDAKYDLIINLEDSLEVGHYVRTLESQQLFGAYVDSKSVLRYTDDSHRWFDLSLISLYGRQQADKLKLQNRYTYRRMAREIKHPSVGP